ncbi:MAG: 4-hydroxy-tetrahydrodipicolinate synthase [Saprospiraceae bacterium]|nr:4-hydroxy-tetrahydrodipicolinate synthase [Saprospiraceae bacterium]
MNFLRGIGTALITPFKGGEVDYPTLSALVERQVTSGVDYLVILGTTGEPVTLTPPEIEAVIAAIISANNSRLPLVLGIFGGNNTAAICNRLKNTNLEGIDALLSSSPHYNKPSQAGIVEHYLALDEVSPLPLIMYNVPGRTGSNMTAETTVSIANRSENIIGIKEASGDMIQGALILKHRPKGFYVLSGDDPTAMPLIALGGEGIISVIANAYPTAFAQMTHAALRQEMAMAQDIHARYLDLHHHLYVEGNPTGIKACCQQLGLCTDEVRLPLVRLSAPARQALLSEMNKIGSLQS